MSQQTSLPQSIVTRLQNVTKRLADSPSDKGRLVAYNNVLSIIASMVAATSASVLQYNADTKHSTVICEYDSRRSGILERRSDVGETYDESEFKILFRWINRQNQNPMMLHLDQLPNNAAERREFQIYAVHSALYLPIFQDENMFWGYVELWESRYKRIYTTQEIADLMQASLYLNKIISA